MAKTVITPATPPSPTPSIKDKVAKKDTRIQANTTNIAEKAQAKVKSKK